MVGMASKPFHVKRLQKALGRPSSQIYSQKRLGVTGNDPNFQCPPAPQTNNPGGAGRNIPLSHNPRVAPAPPAPVPPQSQTQIPPTVSTTTAPRSAPRGPDHYQPHMLKQYQQQHQQQQQPLGLRMPTFSLDKEPPCNPATTATMLSYQTRTQDSTSAASMVTTGSSKQLFLPHYLHPDSESKDLSALVDEMTPIQAELGPCPFKPSDWDERRAELVRRYAAIYGQGNSKRKNEELSLHEENINVAAFQLCLRDPTLLVRRDELLILSRKAIKDGGYTFQHGISKAKGSSGSSETASSLGGVSRKRPLEGGGDGSGSFQSGEITMSLLPLPRNMSREKKLKRVEELEFLITKNKMKQSIKLTALEKARQANDFSMSHHLQAEIESLGNTLANLQEEYSNMKYRLKRSDRYFEKKHKKFEEELDYRLIRVQKKIETCLESGKTPNEQVISGASNHQPSFYQLPANKSTRPLEAGAVESVDKQPPAMNISPTHDASSTSGENTSVSLVQTYSIVTTTATSSSLSHPPSTSPSHLTTILPHSSDATQTSPPPPLPPSSLHNSDMTSIFPQSFPETSSAANRTMVTAQVLPSQQDEGEESGASPTHHQASDDSLPEESQLLVNINKLATQAADNLRSLSHF